MTTTIEEIQIQPKSKAPEQQEQVLQTTTEVEQQPTPQVKTDVSTTQPKPQEQVSEINFAVGLLCTKNTKALIDLIFAL